MLLYANLHQLKLNRKSYDKVLFHCKFNRGSDVM